MPVYNSWEESVIYANPKQWHAVQLKAQTFYFTLISQLLHSLYSGAQYFQNSAFSSVAIAMKSCLPQLLANTFIPDTFHDGTGCSSTAVLGQLFSIKSVAAVWNGVVDQLFSFKLAVVSILGFPQAPRTSRQMIVANTTPGMILSSQRFLKWPAEYKCNANATGLSKHNSMWRFLLRVSPVVKWSLLEPLALLPWAFLFLWGLFPACWWRLILN